MYHPVLIQLQNSDDEQRVVCFNSEKHKPLNKILQAETWCELKRYKLNDKNEIIVNDTIIWKEIKSNFGRQQKQVSYINNEAQLYERINVAGLVFNDSSIEHAVKDGKISRLRKASFQDNSHDVSITFFDSLVDQIEKKTVCSWQI